MAKKTENPKQRNALQLYDNQLISQRALLDAFDVSTELAKRICKKQEPQSIVHVRVGSIERPASQHDIDYIKALFAKVDNVIVTHHDVAINVVKII